MKFVIQKGIPIPQKFSVPPMEIGDSFVAPMKKRSKIYTLFKRDFPQYLIFDLVIFGKNITRQRSWL